MDNRNDKQSGKADMDRLSGHIREKGWLRNPYSQLNLSYVSWKQEMFPEVAWIALAIWAEGKNFEQVMAEANDLMGWYLARQPDKRKAPCILLTSEWKAVTEVDRAATAEEAKGRRWELLSYGAERMARRYGEAWLIPLAGSGDEQEEDWNEEWIAIAEAVAEGGNRDTRLGVVLQGLIHAWCLQAERLYWVKGQADPRPKEWDAALRDPTTEAGARGAASIRSYVLATFNTLRQGSEGDNWVQHFWGVPRRETRCMLMSEVEGKTERRWTDEEWRKFNALSDATRNELGVAMAGYVDEALNSMGRVDEPDYRTVGEGMLARCTSLFLGMTVHAANWTATMAPMVLRCMVEVYIDLKYISRAPKERAAAFIEYGLGEELLAIQQAEEGQRKGQPADRDELIKARVKAGEEWVRARKAEEFTDVPLGGTWAKKNIRQRAIEVDEEELYQYCYQTWSKGTHNSWMHQVRVDTEPCRSPLHLPHARGRIPMLWDAWNPDFMFRACKYQEMVLTLFVDEFGGGVEKLRVRRKFYDLVQVHWPEWGGWLLESEVDGI